MFKILFMKNNLFSFKLTLRKCNSHLQYYKIDFSYIVKLQNTTLNVCKEYIGSSAKRDDKNVPPRRADFLQ